MYLMVVNIFFDLCCGRVITVCKFLSISTFWPFFGWVGWGVLLVNIFVFIFIIQVL